MRLPIPCSLALPAYAFAANIVLPVGLLLATPWLLLQEKRRRTLLPRLGFQPYPGSSGDAPGPLWVHALSVGELLSAVPFIEMLKPRLGRRPLVVSVSTLAARGLAEVRLRGLADALLYFPYDTAIAYRRCLARVRPAMFVLIETDIWPGYLRFFRRRGVPCWLLNARLSPRSFRGHERWGCLFGPAMACFERVHGQSAAENDRFTALGVSPGQLGEPGNLKFDACGPAPSAASVAALRADLGYSNTDRILLGGSTHPGEEQILRTVFLKLRAELPDLKLISVPRHPHRASEVSALFAGDDLKVARLTDHTAAAPDVLIVDRLGYLNRLYGLCEAAFVGGSFAPEGGQNPIEPAAAGKPVLFGPDMSDFPDIARWLIERQAAYQVQDAAALEGRFRELLTNPASALEMGMRGQALIAEHRGATARIAHDLVRRLERIETERAV